MAKELLGDVQPERLFLYLYRRFGPPLQGTDTENVIAEYHLTTDDDNILLRVSIGACYMFGVEVRAAKYREWRDGQYFTFTEERAECIICALRAALLELMGPQHIRDTELTPIEWR